MSVILKAFLTLTEGIIQKKSYHIPELSMGTASDYSKAEPN